MFLLLYILFCFLLIHFAVSIQTDAKSDAVFFPTLEERNEIVNDLIGKNFVFAHYEQFYKQDFAEKILESFRYLHIDGGLDADFIKNLLQKIVQNEIFCKKWLEEYTSGGVYSDLLAITYWYDTKAVRKIEDWQTSNEIFRHVEDYLHDLIPFLFEKYPVPSHLRNIWRYWDFHEEKELSIKVGFTEKNIAQLTLSDLVCFNWYFFVANGGNIRKHEFLPMELSKNAVHYFMTAHNKSLMQAFRWAKTKGIGANDQVAEVMAAELPYFTHDERLIDEILFLLMRSVDATNEDLLKAVRFLKVVMLGDYCHEYDTDNYFLSYLVPKMSLKGKNVNSLLRYRDELMKQLPKINNFIPIENIVWNELMTKKEKYTFELFGNVIFMTPFASENNEGIWIWNISIGSLENVVASIKLHESPSIDQALDFRIALMLTLKEVSLPNYPELEGIDEEFDFCNSEGTNYRIVRLKNYLELYHEGRNLDHCVADYDAQCMTQNCTIWSMTRQDKSGKWQNAITIEYNPMTKKIAQTQGYQNADPTEAEQEVIAAWYESLHKTLQSLNPDGVAMCA